MGELLELPSPEIGVVEAWLRGLETDATRKVYRHVIRSFESWLKQRELLHARRRDVEGYRHHMEELGRAPATVSKHLAALSSFFSYAADDGLLDQNPAARARRPKVSDMSPRKALSPAEVHALLGAVDVDTLIGLRDRVALTLMVVQGWRASEVLGLQVEDLAEEHGHKVATVRGKGGSVLRVPLAAATWTAIRSWLSAADITTGEVLLGVRKGGTVLHDDGAIRSSTLYRRVRFLAKRAGIRPVHPHVLRHTCATVALQAGVPLHQVQDHLRHADPRTTRRYDSHRHSLANPAPHVLAGRLLSHQRGRSAQGGGRGRVER